MDSNHQPSGYGPDELPLLHPATVKDYTIRHLGPPGAKREATPCVLSVSGLSLYSSTLPIPRCVHQLCIYMQSNAPSFILYAPLNRYFFLLTYLLQTGKLDPLSEEPIPLLPGSRPETPIPLAPVKRNAGHISPVGAN